MKPRRRRRPKSSSSAWAWIVVGVVCLAALGGGLVLLLRRGNSNPTPVDPGQVFAGGPGGGSQGAAELQKVVADLDQRDPGWQLSSLLTRPVLDPASNGANLIPDVARQLPRGWSNSLENYPPRRSPPCG